MIRVSGTSDTKTKANTVSLESQKEKQEPETGLEEIITENWPHLEEAKTCRFRKLSKLQTN